MLDIKLIIFDLDGTLYNLDDVVALNYKMQIDFYSQKVSKPRSEVINIFSENGIFPIMTEKSKSATEFFVRSGVSSNEWNSYREEHFDVSMIDKSCAATELQVKDFAEIAPLVLLSSNSFKNITKILSHIGIDKDLFEDIICSDHKYSDSSFKKIDEMKLLKDRYKIDASSVISVGDRFKTDIEPMLSIGGLGVRVNGPQDLSDVLDALKNDCVDKLEVYGLSEGF